MERVRRGCQLGPGGLEVLRDEGGLLLLVVEGERARVQGLLPDELVERRERYRVGGLPSEVRLLLELAIERNHVGRRQLDDSGRLGKAGVHRRVGDVQRDGSEVRLQLGLERQTRLG
jgi:hypothetical protein